MLSVRVEPLHFIGNVKHRNWEKGEKNVLVCRIERGRCTRGVCLRNIYIRRISLVATSLLKIIRGERAGEMEFSRGRTKLEVRAIRINPMNYKREGNN